MRKSLVLALPLAFVVFALAQGARRNSSSGYASAHLPPAAIGALQKIHPEHIRAHVRFLSHDLLEERGSGQRGGDLSAEYIANQYWLDAINTTADNKPQTQNVLMLWIT